VGIRSPTVLAFILVLPVGQASRPVPPKSYTETPPDSAAPTPHSAPPAPDPSRESSPPAPSPPPTVPATASRRRAPPPLCRYPYSCRRSEEHTSELQSR